MGASISWLKILELYCGLLKILEILMDGGDLNCKVLLTTCCIDARQFSWTKCGLMLLFTGYIHGLVLYWLSFVFSFEGSNYVSV